MTVESGRAISDAGSMKTEALLAYADMMDECALKVENIASLAVGIWSEVLKELDKRGLVQLISGSYDNIGDALFRRT